MDLTKNQCCTVVNVTDKKSRKICVTSKKKKREQTDEIESFDFDLGFNLNEVYDQ